MHYHIPFAQTPDIPGLLKWVYGQGLKPVGTDPNLGRWDQEVWRGRIALILGSDVQSMSDDVRPWVRDWVKLPMMGKVESLSSAVAGSVLMYDWLKANREHGAVIQDCMTLLNLPDQCFRSG